MADEYNFFKCIPLTVYNTAGLTGSYAALNGSGFPEAIKLLKIYNGSTTGITISYSGTVDEDYYPAGATIILDMQTNHSCDPLSGSGTKYGRKGQIISGKGTAGVGNLYITGYY